MNNSDIVSLEQFVSSAKMQLGLETTDYDIWFEKLANEAVRHFDCISLLKKNIGVFKACDNKIKLPCGINRVLGLRVGTTNKIYADLNFFKRCGVNNTEISLSPNTDTYQIENGYIYFHNNIDDGTETTVAWLSFNTDSNGLYIGKFDYERGVTSYICWKYTLQNFQKFPRYIQDNYREEWMAQKKWIKTTDFKKTWQEQKLQLREWLNALVVDKNNWYIT